MNMVGTHEEFQEKDGKFGKANEDPRTERCSILNF